MREVSMSAQEKKTTSRAGKIIGAIYEVEVGSPILHEGMIIRIKVKNGQEAVRAYLKLQEIAKAVTKD